ncbi:MAG: aminoacetone oxidase family FAD-binding enzyme [Bacilli bacterium]|nr:aminoacetone oxidase family FAD-binding enzyme [Bacilli bacterium]
MKVVVVGGGASGLMCAIRIASRGIDVTLLEKNNNTCKKLLVTGNGKCNYFNSDMDIKHYHSSDNNLVSDIISEGNINLLKQFFHNIGIVPRIKNGYYYPYSNTATTLKNLLLLEAKRLNINIKTDTIVTKIIKEQQFILKTNSDDIICDKVVLALGSRAYIKDEYNGYRLLEELGHHIIKPLPALVMLEGSGNYFKDWVGIRTDAIVSLYSDNEFIDKQEGEVQLTNYGISGICIMNLSGRVARMLDDGKKVSLKINFIPFISNGYDYLEERSKLLKEKTIIEMLESIINYKLLYAILKKCHINDKCTWKDLNKEDKNLLVENIFNFKLDIVKTKDFECAQVVTGGLSLQEVTDKLESKIVSGLFIVGELLDVDGDCGGYNLGFAWLSGLVVGDNI